MIRCTESARFVQSRRFGESRGFIVIFGANQQPLLASGRSGSEENPLDDELTSNVSVGFFARPSTAALVAVC
jgi:hypothetical protein